MMRRVLLACSLCLASLAHAQSPAGYTEAKQRADADEASLPSGDADTLRETQGVALDSAIAGCATPTADTSPFVVVAELDATGKVVRTWREGGTPLAICVQKQIAGRTLSAPPRAPFFTSFELSFTR
ncbi:hypothetical protein J2X02_001810 [Pseudoxanthomonas japonensis]|jgi:hypothetical protein|uniref:hypothetical protein n=1 Tax=Pseudoxanthomonas TaxID=83618 RepID=UPI000ABE8094|nr:MULTISPECIES: hypothetical protein [Pseudoxanthomonas]MDR7068959.1 hypothetical protein [Pseudoxanthomonas japonensis]